MESREDLYRLGRAILLYIEENNEKWPLSNKWCDLLLQSGYATKKDLIFRGRGKERGYYAINPDCGPNSPPDTVLLFEAKGGWNQFGGPEILTTENHKGEGCNILFIDLHVYFVKTEELEDLNWGDGKE
jgi:prepilin-type processing-associated H-X9-DG protein